MPVPDLPGLRPTGDRVRETLFNWLQPRLAGARCLDLFAGTGALGLEALSRGASRVTLVERSRPAVDHLRRSISSLNAEDETELVHQDAMAFLASAASAYDIIFLDPPFADDLLSRAWRCLDQRELCTPSGAVYLECAREQTLPYTPADWRWHRKQTAGGVRFALAFRGME